MASQPLMQQQPEQGKYRQTMQLKHTIYSALVYGPAVNRIRDVHSTSASSRTLYFMAAVNFIVQLGVLYVMLVYSRRDAAEEQIITTDTSLAAQQDLRAYEDIEMRRGSAAGKNFLSGDGEDLTAYMPFFSLEPESVCTLRNGMYTCASNSLRLTSQWDLLDKNGDGVWGADEAIGSKDGSSAVDNKHAVYFAWLISSLKDRAQWLQQNHNETLYLSQDILTARGIPKAYFDYWTGDVQFCAHFHPSTCKYIVTSGIFESALTKGKIAAHYKGISDLHSAVTYCYMMLEEHGFCEKALPASYAQDVAKRESVCGELTMQSAGVLRNPSNPSEVMQVMLPKYTKLSAQSSTHNAMFIFFTIVLMYLFYGSLVKELKSIIRNFDFLLNFPSIYSEEDPGGVDHGKEAEKQFTVERLQPRHRLILMACWVLRVLIFLLLVYFGTQFLLMQTNYVDLVLNAVALVFITEVDEMLYDTFLDPNDKKEMGLSDNCHAVEWMSRIPKAKGYYNTSWGASLMANHTWGLIFVPIIAISVVMYFHVVKRNPDIEALKCACLQEGSKCAESLDNRGTWWNHYWARTLPAVIHKIEAMRLQGL